MFAIVILKQIIMETAKSVEIIQNMMNESKKSLIRNSFFFILWALLLVPSGIVEYFLSETQKAWMVWPVMGIVGGIASMIYGKRESARVGVSTFSDRVTAYTWGAFGFGLIFSIALSLRLHFPPHAMILLISGMATFISGGISSFKPFVYGAITLAMGAILCGFIVEAIYHSLVFSASIFVGYLIPGIQLRKLENEQTK